MPKVQTAQNINDICSIVFAENPEGPRHFFLYAEVEAGMIAPSLVQIYDDHIFWLVPWGISDALYQIWQNASGDEKWWALTIEISEEKFTAQFDYDRATPPDEHSSERADAAIKAKFPSLPLRYSSFDQKAFELEVMRHMSGQAASFELDPTQEADSDRNKS